MKKILIFIMLFPILFSCEEFLNVEQINLVYNEIFWENERDAEKGVLGIYALYRGLMVNPQNWYERGDVTTGFFHRGWNGGSPNQLYSIGDFDNVSGPKSWGELETYADWSKFYKVIAQANLVISKVKNIPSGKFQGDNKEKLLGEAYFLRALTYFNILQIWGNAPYISESIESSTQLINDDLTPILIGRTDDVEIGINILGDIELAIEKLQYGTMGSRDWGIRANKGSAEALSGHINMWMHFLAKRDNLPNPDMYIEAAIQNLESCVKNGNYQLADYSDPDLNSKLFGGQSSEAVFELNISSQDNESYRVDRGGIINLTCKIAPLDGDVTKDRASSINYVPRAQKMLVYPEYDIETQTGDIRPNLFFESWESPYNEPFSDVSQVATDRELVTWMKKYALMSVDPLHSWNEYIPYFAEANIPVIRYTDAYLLLAEAYCKNNQENKAIPIVNEIRNRANLPVYSGSNLLGEVLQQRISELIGEGQIYYDMVRNNNFPNPQIMDAGRYYFEGYYWPVSNSILVSNKMISQTPFWNGKTKF